MRTNAIYLNEFAPIPLAQNRPRQVWIEHANQTIERRETLHWFCAEMKIKIKINKSIYSILEVADISQ